MNHAGVPLANYQQIVPAHATTNLVVLASGQRLIEPPIASNVYLRKTMLPPGSAATSAVGPASVGAQARCTQVPCRSAR